MGKKRGGGGEREAQGEEKCGRVCVEGREEGKGREKTNERESCLDFEKSAWNPKYYKTFPLSLTVLGSVLSNHTASKQKHKMLSLTSPPHPIWNFWLFHTSAWKGLMHNPFNTSFSHLEFTNPNPPHFPTTTPTTNQTHLQNQPPSQTNLITPPHPNPLHYHPPNLNPPHYPPPPTTLPAPTHLTTPPNPNPPHYPPTHLITPSQLNPPHYPTPAHYPPTHLINPPTQTHLINPHPPKPTSLPPNQPH